MSNTITLNFVNESNDQNNSQIVIFQKDETANLDNTTVAWQVINNVGRGSHIPFEFSHEMSLVTTDNWGNGMNQPLAGRHGQMFRVHSDNSGQVLSYEGAYPEQSELQVRNDLSNGSINANIYKDGKLLAKKLGITPGQKAVFKFEPTLWIGVVPQQIEEGQLLDSAIMKQINTELSLLGIKSADIVMTGGGSEPYQFELENVVYE